MTLLRRTLEDFDLTLDVTEDLTEILIESPHIWPPVFKVPSTVVSQRQAYLQRSSQTSDRRRLPEYQHPANQLTGPQSRRHDEL